MNTTFVMETFGVNPALSVHSLSKPQYTSVPVHDESWTRGNRQCLDGFGGIVYKDPRECSKSYEVLRSSKSGMAWKLTNCA